MEAKVDKNGKTKSFVRQKPPDRGYVPWDKGVFDRLAIGRPEALQSVFRLDHGMVMAMLHRAGGMRALAQLIGLSHERPVVQMHLRRELARCFRTLHAAGVVALVPREGRRGRDARVAEGLQHDFSLHHTLSLWLVAALGQLDPEQPDHALDVVSLCEAILENPGAVLFKQVAQEKTRLINQWKDEGVPYEERMERLQHVTWPKPAVMGMENSGWIYLHFNLFAGAHPWVGDTAIRPKMIARLLVEHLIDFDDLVRDLGLQPMEGVLLRYLTQVYKTLLQNVPADAKTDAVHEAIGHLRAVVASVDSSLLQEWEQLVAIERGEVPVVREVVAPPPPPDPRAIRAHLRAGLFAVVKALAAHDWDEVEALVRAPEGAEDWTAERLAALVAKFEEEHGRLVFGHRERMGDTVSAERVAGRWRLSTALATADEASDWQVVVAESDEGDFVELVELGR